MSRLHFSRQEYIERLNRVRAGMAANGIELLLVSDPANQNWLTGHEGWSFYVPQIVAVSLNEDPLWLGRAMDAPGALATTWMSEPSIVPYPENYVQRREIHPCDHMAEQLASRGFATARIGYESDGYYFSPRALEALKGGLANATFADDGQVVNWARMVKSEAEIGYMRDGARLVEAAMRRAYEVILPGVRQCDAAAEIYQAQLSGSPDFGGDITSLCPMILAGEMSSTAHPIWTDEAFENNQTIALELAGARHRYHSALARTMQLGTAPQRLLDTADAVGEGLEAVLAVVRSGVTAGEVHAAWQSVLDRYGLTKESRIGYGIGVGYPPDWGEHTISLRAGEATILEENATVHVMLGMWMDGWGMEMSETVRVGATGPDVLTDFPREIFIKS